MLGLIDMQSLQIALVALIGTLLAVVTLHMTGILPALFSEQTATPIEEEVVATGTDSSTPPSVETAAVEPQPKLEDESLEIELDTDQSVLEVVSLADEPVTPTGTFTVRAGSAKFNSSRWIPIPNMTREAAGRLCALAVGHACAWNDEFLQQTTTFADVVTDQRLSVSVVRETDGMKVVLANLAESDAARYRLYAATYDILGRPDRVYELHVTDYEMRDQEIWFDWDHKIRFVDEEGQALSTSLPNGFQVSIIAVSVDTGVAGHRHHVLVPGARATAAVVESIPSLFPEYRSQFYNLAAVPPERGRLVDGGEGFDTVSYEEALATKSFVVGVNTDTNQNVIAVVTEPDFIDVLVNIERIIFTDQEILVSELRTAVAKNPNEVVYANYQAAVPGLLR